MRTITLLLLVVITWVVNVFHMSTVPLTDGHLLKLDAKAPESFFLAKKESDLNHLFLFGTAYQRGLRSGELTKDLLAQTEDKLFTEFEKFFPNPLVRWSLIVGILRWFSGYDEIIPTHFLEQGYGVSRSSLGKYNHILDAASMSIAYHGIHEVGQMFVDFERNDFGCTAFAVKQDDSWMIARNFDFEVGRFFDENKILQWHFPNNGLAYVSVIWPGMFGTTTGINEAGVYISINAAGSEDFKRLGIPSTLIVTQALQSAKTAREAVRIIEAANVFISDLYLVSDTNEAYKVEKSPKRFASTRLNEDTALANHFTSKIFADDMINQFRRDELTSNHRLKRAEKLLSTINQKTRSRSDELTLKLLGFLRDKKDENGLTLALGHRHAIDALIATHSVIYDAKSQQLFVNEGPALVGKFFGYDLRRSFAEREPVRTYDLPSDNLTPKQFYALRSKDKR